jgi:hypothetical protein
MGKKSRSTAQSPLSHYWTPPPVEIEGGLGAPSACLATTYEFDAEFFETELLPRFLGLKFDQTENEPSFLVEREEALALSRVAVLVDHSRFDSSQTTLRWDQVPIQVPGGIQHAKITILAWENLIRVLIGSANLNRGGYRRNREMFAALDFWNGADSTPLGVLTETLDLIDVLLTWSRSSIASIQRTHETVDRLRQMLRRWPEAPPEFTPRQRPRVRLVATHPRTNGQAARSTLDEVVELWGNRRATVITVVTPFTAPEPDAEAGDPVVNKLGQVLRSRDCEGWLVLPELPKTPEDPRTRLPFPEILKESWKGMFQRRGGAYVLSLPLCVEGKEDRNRDLHTKCLVLESENDDVALMMIGSSNFTPRGMGVGRYNVEANLVFEDIGSVQRNGFCLADRLVLPRGWEEGLLLDDPQLVWQKTPDERPEDEPDPLPTLPGFFAWATFSQKSGELRLVLDRNHQEPDVWSVRLPGSPGDAPTLFSRRVGDEHPLPDTLIHVFPESMRAVNIVALIVTWQDSNSQLQQAKLGVSVQSEEDLLPPEQFLKLDADAIIECLISGKSPAQWYDDHQGEGGVSPGQGAVSDSLRSVDTSAFLLYRVRRFGRALTGMAQRILRTLVHPDAIRYRLLADPFGPVSLARSISQVNRDEQNGWCATLDDEHRLFLLAEILLLVSHLRVRLIRNVKGEERTAIDEVFETAMDQLQQLADCVTADDSVPENLRNYLTCVRTLARSNHAETEVVEHVD